MDEHNYSLTSRQMYVTAHIFRLRRLIDQIDAIESSQDRVLAQVYLGLFVTREQQSSSFFSNFVYKDTKIPVT